jgi:hypothetical protein
MEMLADLGGTRESLAIPRVFQKKRFARQTNYFKFSVRTTSDVTSAGPGSMVSRTILRMTSTTVASLDDDLDD